MSRNRRPPAKNRRVPWKQRPWLYWFFSLLLLSVIGALVLDTGMRFPMQTGIVLAIVVGCLLAIGLYVGELVVIGWIMDFPAWLAERALPAAHVPLDYEQVGEITIVTLSDNIASARECRSVQQQLDRLIGEQFCDLVLDFSQVKKLSSRFRDVLVHVKRMTEVAAKKRRLPRREIDLLAGETFPVFENRQHALAEMGRHAGHGWVVLCAVPIGIRAVSD